MLSIIFLLCFFLYWSYLSSRLYFLLVTLGEVRAFKFFEKKRSLYISLHKSLFKRKSYSLLLTAISIFKNIGHLGYGISLFFLLYEIFDLSYLPLLAVTLLLFLLFIFCADLLPKLLSSKTKEKAFHRVLSYSTPFLFICFPFTFPFLKWESRFADRKKEKKGLEEELKETILHILYTTDLKEPLNTFDKKLLESVIKFKERIVREVMIPRVDLFCLPSNISIREGAHRLADEGYSRTPLFRDTIDDIVGVLLYKDVLEIYMECEKGKKPWSSLDAPIETLSKRVFYTPETKKISNLLQEFRGKQMHMAIVIDEYGGTEGIVTIEDLLEEIVGEIGDEYDADEESLYVLQPGGSWIVDAYMNISDAEDTFNIQLPQEGDYDTLAGYVFDIAKAIPPKGYVIKHQDFDLEVISTSERSIEKVKITPKHIKR